MNSTADNIITIYEELGGTVPVHKFGGKEQLMGAILMMISKRNLTTITNNDIIVYARETAQLSETEFTNVLRHEYGHKCDLCRKFDMYMTIKQTIEGFISTMEKKKQINRSITVSQHNNPNFNHHSKAPSLEKLFIYRVESTTNTMAVTLGEFITCEEAEALIEDGITVNVKPLK